MKKNDETFNQIYVVSFLKKLQLSQPDIGLVFFSVPNGGTRNKMEAANLKLSGMTAGIPDLCLLTKGRTLFIEMKKHKGTLSSVQQSIIYQLSNIDIPTHVIYADTPHEAIEKIAPIMSELGFGQNTISQASSSALAGLGGAGGVKS